MAYNQDPIFGGEDWTGGAKLNTQASPINQPPAAPTPPPAGPSAPPAASPQDWSGPWDATKVKSYFDSRGVAANSSSPDYWAGKWNEWGSKDPDYFMSRLSTADEFNPGGQPSGGPPPMSAGGFGGFGGAGGSFGGASFSQANVPAQGSPWNHYEDSGKDTQLRDILMGRATQSLNVNPEDPIIKHQVDAYRAEQDRGAKNMISAAAEHGGPHANMDAQSRSAYEKSGQATAGFQSQLMQQELNARRDEIKQALSESGSLLSQQDQLALQRELGLITSQLSAQNMGQNYDLGLRGLNLGQQQLNSGNDQFMANFGLNSTNQASYWDAIRRGIL